MVYWGHCLCFLKSDQARIWLSRRDPGRWTQRHGVNWFWYPEKAKTPFVSSRGKGPQNPNRSVNTRLTSLRWLELAFSLSLFCIGPSEPALCSLSSLEVFLLLNLGFLLPFVKFSFPVKWKWGFYDSGGAWVWVFPGSIWSSWGLVLRCSFR